MKRVLAAVVVASIAAGGAAWWSERGVPAGRESAARPVPVTRLIIGSDHRYPDRLGRTMATDTFRLVRVSPATHGCTVTSTRGTSTLICIFR